MSGERIPIVEFPCPGCGRTLVRVSGYPDYCEACDHSLLGDRPLAPAPTRAQQRVRIAWQDSLLDVERSGAARGGTVLRALGGAVAAAVLVFPLLMLAAAVAIAVSLRHRGPLAVLAVAALVALAWTTRPRIAPRPSGATPASAFPALDALLSSVTASLGSRPIELVAIEPDINASMSLVTWRRTPLLTIGAPLIELLTPAELLGVLAHEAAHLVNGDPARSILFGNALMTLRRSRLRAGGASALNRTPFGFLVAIPWLVLRAFTAGAEALLSKVVDRDSQRAEYRADLLATRLAGSAAMQTSLQNMEQGDLVAYARRVAAARSMAPRELLAELVRNRPERETVRLSRLARMPELWPTDASHPPTHLRMQLLDSSAAEPDAALAGYDHAAIVRELASRLDACQ